MSSTAIQLPGYVSDAEAAELLGYSVVNLRRLRRLGEGPRYIKRGQRVCYRLADLSSWLDEGIVDPRAS
ncbi:MULTISPECIES: helix-turn-helix transcriptional regulator [unclassified Nocardioides]|uniref:helix-turn-helix transcriptional regulator n=1 Tax=unclassified Nocardioides TaxID=2615069 RepID=UPI0007024349|nr:MULTISPECIES: helix-turn-helix domain-containing protein [unclassified Nocardioides]KRC53942.1 hypothetical protein ASE19_07630 [Nocardioides sp. Root79]KRC71278.1 hypothetical protein ASE20_10045 [Nocardioides sp. Root240]